MVFGEDESIVDPTNVEASACVTNEQALSSPAEEPTPAAETEFEGCGLLGGGVEAEPDVTVKAFFDEPPHAVMSSAQAKTGMESRRRVRMERMEFKSVQVGCR